MNEIKKSDPNIIDRLAIAMKGAKVQELTLDEVKAIYRRCLVRMGINVKDAEKARIQSQMILEDIQRDFPSLSKGELNYLCDQGALGKYGENKGLNPATVYRWVNCYLESQIRSKAWERKRAPVTHLKIKNDIDPHQVLESAKLAYQQSGNEPKAMAHLYDLAFKAGKLNVLKRNKELQERVREAARENFRYRKQDAESLMALRHLQSVYTEENTEMFNVQCKREAFKMWLKGEI